MEVSRISPEVALTAGPDSAPERTGRNIIILLLYCRIILLRLSANLVRTRGANLLPTSSVKLSPRSVQYRSYRG